MLSTSANTTSAKTTATTTVRPPLKLLILRGCPGSGKTVLATKTKAFTNGKWKVVSADNFFYKPDGMYVFDRKKLQDAHNQCFTDAYNYLTKGFNVIVDNTNRRCSEFSKYLKLANNESLPKVEIKVYSMRFQYGSDKLHPHHIIQRFFDEYEYLKGERYVSLNLATGCIEFHEMINNKAPIGFLPN